MNTDRGSAMVPFLIGAGVGAVAALLFAPKSGEELRSDIADRGRQIGTQGQEIAGRVQESVSQAASQARQTVARVQDQARQTVARVQDQARQTVSQAREQARQAFDAGKEAYTNAKNPSGS